MGQIFSQQVIPPWEVNWPRATSRKNTGKPPPNRKMKYGMRNAPRYKQDGEHSDKYVCLRPLNPFNSEDNDLLQSFI